MDFYKFGQCLPVYNKSTYNNVLIYTAKINFISISFTLCAQLLKKTLRQCQKSLPGSLFNIKGSANIKKVQHNLGNKQKKTCKKNKGQFPVLH